MAALGDERPLRAARARRARGSPAATPAVFAHGAVAELVERCAWAKVEVVLADEREAGGRPGRVRRPRRAARIEAGRLALNLGHSLGHGFEAAAGYGDALLHGEAVAYGLRAACRIGVEPGRHAGRVAPPGSRRC